MNKKSDVVLIPINQVKADPKQPRQEFELRSLARLKDSIERQGIMVPLILEKQKDGSYLIIDGERRYRSSLKLGLKEIPAIVTEETDEFSRQINRFHLQEQHLGWTAYDKAQAVYAMKQSVKVTDQELADMLGLSKTTIQGYLGIHSLSKRTAAVVAEKKIPYVLLRSLSQSLNRMNFPEKRKELEDSIVKKIADGLIVRGSDLRSYQVAVNEGGEKIANKIINDPKYTALQALKDAEAYAFVSVRSLMQNANFMKMKLKWAIKEEIEDSFTDFQKGILSDISIQIQKIIK